MQLKQYQAETLATLRKFFEEARVIGPKAAYETITSDPDQAKRLGRYAGNYIPLKGLPNVPYVCLRLPTGGGKTILGARSISIARDAWIEKDYPMVLWLVPSNTIRLQTAEALKNTQHPYRQALDGEFDGRVRVFDIADFAHIRTHDIRDYCCIVVGTIQTLRVKNTLGRKVYSHNENLESHFSALPGALPGLERLEDGGVKYSFANLIHLHQPLMVVDEAHNAVTGLTREMQARTNPSAIIEFTATPRTNSNILHSVSAQELKHEEMIKLPIILSEHDTWQNAVNGAIAARASLARTAERDPDYIRPIVLFQAQQKNQEITVDILKKHLIEVEQIAEEKIAIATGAQRELDGINLFDPKSPIEYVITIEALKEGWDCSFAYAFCSVSRIQSALDVEQLLGRVLRMPYAKRRNVEELNRAYAFLSEPSFGHAARALADKLVAMGFEEDEAWDYIEPSQSSLDSDTGEFEPPFRKQSTFIHSISVSSDALAQLEKEDHVSSRMTDQGETEIVIVGRIDQELENKIASILSEEDRKDFIEAVTKYRGQLSPAELGAVFQIPRLMAQIQGELEPADIDSFMESHEWSLLNHSPKLGEYEFTIHETGRSFEIYLDDNRVTYRTASQETQLSLDVTVEGWSREGMVIWLDRMVRQADILQSEMLHWLSELVGHLVDVRGISLSTLMACKYTLARKVREKITDIRQQEHNKVYQNCLFAPEVWVEVSFDQPFSFEDGMYSGQPSYRGHWKPHKHFLGPDGVPSFDGVENGEEFQCAQILDSLPGLKFWIRNVARHPNSFWLPTARGKFYPDFIAKLDDGRLFVVEYKGAHIASGSDTAEKRVIGKLWEQKSSGRGLFIIVEKTVDNKDMQAQLIEKITK